MKLQALYVVRSKLTQSKGGWNQEPSQPGLRSFGAARPISFQTLSERYASEKSSRCSGSGIRVRDSGGIDIHAQFGVDARVGRPTPGGLLVEEQLGAAATARPLEDGIDEAKATRLRSLRMIDAVRSAKYVQPRPAKGLCIEDYARGNLSSTAVADAVALYTAAYAAVDAAEGRSFRSVSANGSDLALPRVFSLRLKQRSFARFLQKRKSHALGERCPIR